jgi:hypothetical protein
LSLLEMLAESPIRVTHSITKIKQAVQTVGRNPDALPH